MTPALRSLLLVATPFLALLLAAALPRRVDLLLLNGSTEPVVVTVGDDEPFDLEPGAVRRVAGLPARTTHVEAVDADGATVRALDLHLVASLLHDRPAWVCEVAGVASFAVVARGYGDRAGAAPPPVAFEPPSRPAFPLPVELLRAVAGSSRDPVEDLDGEFPKEAQADPGTGGKGAVRAALWTLPRLRAACPPAELTVDNNLRWPLRVEASTLRGGAWAQAAEPGRLDADKVGTIPLPPGRHQLRATELLPSGQDGPTHVAELEVPAAPFAAPRAWVWNVGGLAKAYKVVAATYEQGQQAPPVEDWVPKEFVFEAPPGFLPGLDRPLPERSTARVVRALWTARRLQLERVRRTAPAALPPGDLPGGPR